MKSGPTYIELLGLGVRWFLGLWVGWLGLLKAWDPVLFLKAVRQYGLIDTPWVLNATAILLPWLEVFSALLLLLGIAVRGTAWLLAGMLVGFTVLVGWHGWQLHVAHQMPFCAIRFDCGCGTGEIHLCTKLAENAVLIGSALWLGTGRAGQLWSVRYHLVRSCVST
ncbi:MAG: hypothetical protein RMN51_01505 [Verrucomicrobiota bacterium]|nr:hypothetical protein [Limisphaera sp.]MDW8380775.1 hypothetical protein [Verrucomicrobiota bacterium]